VTRLAGLVGRIHVWEVRREFFVRLQRHLQHKENFQTMRTSVLQEFSTILFLHEAIKIKSSGRKNNLGLRKET
jgi:hypothetical protein